MDLKTKIDKIIFNKWDSSKVFRIVLIVLDAFAIYYSSILAMMARFNSSVSGIPGEYYDAITGMSMYNIAFTIIVIYLCRLYNSIWRFASIKEIMYIFAATMISTVANFLVYFGFSIPIFRSYFPLYFLILFSLIFIERF